MPLAGTLRLNSLDCLVRQVYLCVEFSEKHQLADKLDRSCKILSCVDALADRDFQEFSLCRQVASKGIQKTGILLLNRFLELLAGLQLLHQEVGRHLRVGLERDID